MAAAHCCWALRSTSTGSTAHPADRLTILRGSTGASSSNETTIRRPASRLIAATLRSSARRSSQTASFAAASSTNSPELLFTYRPDGPFCRLSGPSDDTMLDRRRFRGRV